MSQAFSYENLGKSLHLTPSYFVLHYLGTSAFWGVNTYCTTSVHDLRFARIHLLYGCPKNDHKLGYSEVLIDSDLEALYQTEPIQVEK